MALQEKDQQVAVTVSPEAIRSFGWADTSLGPMSSWSQAAKSTVGTISLSSAPMLTVWGTEGWMIFNDGYAKLVDNPRISVLGSKVRETLPEIADFYDSILKKGAADCRAYAAASTFLVRLDADAEPALTFSCSPVVDEHGGVCGMLAVVDVSRQETPSATQLHMGQSETSSDMSAATESFEAIETWNRQILDGALDYAILSLDRDSRIRLWNEGARRMFGWTADEVLQQNWEMLFTPEDQAERSAENAMTAALELGTAHHDRWHLRKSGERFWASGSISTLLDDSGKPVGFIKVLRDMTREHLALQALTEAEASLRRAQEAGGVGIFSLDLIADTIKPTPEFCRIFGLPFSDTVPVDVVQALIHEDDLAAASDSAARRDGIASLEAEYRIRRATDGAERVIARRGEFERDKEGRPVRLLGVVRDITERRKAQRELRESEERFRALAQAIPNQVWTAKPNGELDWFNDRVIEFSGLSAEQLSGTGWAQMVHPDDLEASLRHWERALEQRSTYQTEFRLRRHDGQYRWYIARAVVLVGEDGNMLRWIGTNTDIHEQREARAKLEELNRTLEEHVAARTADRDRMWRLSTDIMLVADFKATILSVNPAWTAVFGWQEQELLGTSFTDLIHEDDLAATLAEVGKLSDGVTTFSFENRYQAKDGTYRVVSWTAVPNEGHIHAVGRDVTEERMAAEALKKAELALQQAQKMEAIGNLTGGVAHDFNNLLQVVSGNLQLLYKEVSGNDRAKKRIDNALAGVARGSKLASQLLAFGRRQALDPRALNMGRLIQGMDEMLRRTIGEGVEIETVVAGGLWNTLADPAQTENALLNLAINARDAMDGFGKLTIEAGNAYIDDLYVRQHQDVAAGQYVLLSVTDTGTGMTPELVEKVFEPFFSTKPEGKGTGLGLSMVYGFVKQSGGHVKIYSERGHGTTVKIYLPRSLEQEDLPVNSTELPLVGGTETVLVAEDDEAVRATVVELLQEFGYRVVKAGDASAALNIIESGLHIDLLFTDVVMPGSFKSTDLARKAKERLPNLAVLFTSGYTENSIVHGGRLDKGVQLLSKPYTKEALARKVRRVLDLQKEGGER